MRPSRLTPIAILLFGSGFCALIYQTVWMREFRLIFGASTAASAAVLAIFMGGLGFGAIRLGRNAERVANPLRFYGLLELGVALLAALSPGLLEIAERLYLLSGGSTILGLFVATIFRLVLATLVLGAPAFLMGGTLPAASRYVENASDRGRHRAAALYGVNTLGAVTGVLVATFFALEHLGNRNTLWSAAIVNAIVGAVALAMARGEVIATTPTDAPRKRPHVFVLLAACITGFAFLLMELVWYRMLTPLLGGTLYTFGLILAAALLGIGIGSVVYALRTRREATIASFATVCAIEALLLIVPFALGDRVAVLALLLRPLGAVGFSGYLLGWFAIVFLAVLPASIASGVQFPMLIALLGSGDENVATDVGEVYAWNTIGAIAGSIGGGFGLLPLLSATGAWRLAAVLLCAISLIAIFLATHRRTAPGIAIPIGAVLLAIVCTAATGPTPAWRDSPIGAGRVDRMASEPNGVVDWLHYRRRIVEWEKDGVESTIALTADDGYAFAVNGKVDGHSRFDAPTQVMLGIIGAFLHPNAKSAFVLGLGTGSTAGWLAAVPSIDRVDVAELEPLTLRVANACTPVNHDLLRNPKAHIVIGDGREILMTSRGAYDVISSEPSNVYRAGVAALYTKAFYAAAVRKLRPGGIFLQWVQAYDVDPETFRTVYATFHDVFPNVETWETEWGDLLLVGSREPLRFDANVLRARMQQEPFRSAFLHVWRAMDLEGVVAHYVGGTQTADLLAGDAPRNSDDKQLIEFGFARALGEGRRVDVNDVRMIAKVHGDDLPETTAGRIDRGTVERRRLSMIVATGGLPFVHPFLDREMLARRDTSTAFMRGDLRQVLMAWTSQRLQPDDPAEILTFSDAEAEQGSENAMLLLNALRATEPFDADVVVAHLRWKQNRIPEAADALERAFAGARRDPWALRVTLERGLEMMPAIAAADPSRQIARRFYGILSQPLAVRLMEQERIETRLLLASMFDPPPGCTQATLDALHAFEPDVPWRRALLARRADCYRDANDPLATRAAGDLKRFDASESRPLQDLIEQRPRTTASSPRY